MYDYLTARCRETKRITVCPVICQQLEKDLAEEVDGCQRGWEDIQKKLQYEMRFKWGKWAILRAVLVEFCEVFHNVLLKYLLSL